jgi:hypothetical protein
VKIVFMPLTYICLLKRIPEKQRLLKMGENWEIQNFGLQNRVELPPSSTVLPSFETNLWLISIEVPEVLGN